MLRAYVIFAIYETKTLTTDPADLARASTTRFYPEPTVLPSHPAQPLCLRGGKSVSIIFSSPKPELSLQMPEERRGSRREAGAGAGSPTVFSPASYYFLCWALITRRWEGQESLEVIGCNLVISGLRKQRHREMKRWSLSFHRAGWPHSKLWRPGLLCLPRSSV